MDTLERHRLPLLVWLISAAPVRPCTRGQTLPRVTWRGCLGGRLPAARLGLGCSPGGRRGGPCTIAERVAAQRLSSCAGVRGGLPWSEGTRPLGALIAQDPLGSPGRGGDGARTHQGRSLSPPVPPNIEPGPVSKAVLENASVTLECLASGVPPPGEPRPAAGPRPPSSEAGRCPSARAGCGRNRRSQQAPVPVSCVSLSLLSSCSPSAQYAPGTARAHGLCTGAWREPAGLLSGGVTPRGCPGAGGRG